jgi:aminopeptidase N
MTHRFRRSLALATGSCGLFLVGCAPPPSVDLEAGVSWSLAEHRHRTISDLRYEVSLSIPADEAEAVQGRLVARFVLGSAADPVAFDFAQSTANVLAVSVNGDPVSIKHRNEHVVIPRGATRPGKNTVTVDFVAGEGSLNRHEDYLYSLFVPDRARVALPILDQPDLKARYRLRLEVPVSWEAVSNATVDRREVAGDRATFSFNETEPISTYVFAFAAGRFEVESAERGGRRFRLFHRETDREKLERNLSALFDLHAAAVEWLEGYTGLPYPFEKLDFVLIPGFQYQGMEHAGAIFYRARALLLEESATQEELLGRASLIAHEAAHMWFGNLVTMRWFEDVWMKEVFANFMAAKIVNPAFPEIDHDLRFLLAHYPAAYRVDRTAGANPVRQTLDNLNEAGSLYGAIIYQKAPIVMKHLELLMGEAAFREGLRRYLAEHRYANASWPDLIAILDTRTSEDLVTWSEVWVNEARRPTVTTEVETVGGKVVSLRLAQRDPEDRGRLWNQRLEVALGYADGSVRRIPAHLRGPRLEVAEASGAPAPDYVLANGAGIGYGDFELEDGTREHLLEHLPGLPDPRLRAVAWISLWDAMLEGAVSPVDLVDLALEALESEDEELNVQRLLDGLADAYWRFVSPEARRTLAPQVEALLWRSMTGTSRPTLKAAYFGAYRRVALTQHGVDRLERVWREEGGIEGLPLAEGDFTALAQGLAVRGVARSEEILTRQLERITNPDRRAEFEFIRPALSGDPAERDRFFESLKDPASREHEPWVLAALGHLHHPLRAARAERYIRPSLDMLEEIQRTGDIFFPLGWLDATLGGHSSSSAARAVRDFLDERPDLPPRLRGKLLQAADPLFRATHILEGASPRPGS